MKTQIISRNLSDGSTVHAVRITDSKGHWIELDAIGLLEARYFEIGFKSLVDDNTNEEINIYT